MAGSAIGVTITNTPEISKNSYKLIVANSQLKIRKLAEVVGISNKAILCILTEVLFIRNCAQDWMQCLLTILGLGTG